MSLKVTGFWSLANTVLSCSMTIESNMRSSLPFQMRSDLADEIQTRLQCLVARAPFSGADFVGMRSHELRGLYLAQELVRVTADSVVVDLGDLDAALGVDDEGAAVSEAFLFDVDAKGLGQMARRISQHRIIDLADGIRGVMPGLVGK